jgi:hypothetical protein
MFSAFSSRLASSTVDRGTPLDAPTSRNYARRELGQGRCSETGARVFAAFVHPQMLWEGEFSK